MADLPEHVQQLITIYRKAQENLVKIIAQKEARGNVTWYQKSLLKQITAELKKLNSKAKQWVDTAIPKSYRQGFEETNRDLRRMGIDIKGAETFSKLHTRAVSLLAANAYADLSDANTFVGRRIKDAIRMSGIDAVSQKVAQGSTVKQCKKNLIAELIREGINGIRDKNGRMISLDAYAQTVARSTTAEATNKATLNQLTELGYDLVKMTEHATSCPICLPLQGRVYSISGKDKRYPPLNVAHSGPYANIHPNCRHRLFPYIEALADDIEGDRRKSNRPFDIYTRSKAQLDRYNKIQKQKRQMRSDRDQWQRYLLALPNDTPKNFGSFRAMKKSDSEKWRQLQKDYRHIMKNNGIMKITAKQKIDKLLKGADVSNRITFAKHLLDDSGLDHIKLSTGHSRERGFCEFDTQSLRNDIKIIKYHLQDPDNRTHEYQIKTVFHEFYHASSDGLKHDILKIGFENWAKIDDTFAECTAHYLNKKAGITHEIMPAYADHLINNLPQLKQLPEFKDCRTIIDFGEKFAKFRFEDEKKSAEWEKYYNHCYNQFDVKNYAKQYYDYAVNNIEDITDKIIENSPQYVGAREFMINDFKNAWDKIKNNNGNLLENEEYMFSSSLIVAMNREGVK